MAAAQVLQPYSVDHFNTIPLLHDVAKTFQAKNGPMFVEKVFRPMVLRHKLESQLGIGLLHRHFDLEGFEKLVELNNISSPWAVKGENHMGGKVLPCSWLINSGKLMPYEFFFAPGASDAEEGSGSGGGNGPRSVVDKALDLTESIVRAFLGELLPVMEAYNLNDTLALRLFPGPDYPGGHEITHGRTNITLTPEQFKGVTKDNSIEAAWFFDPSYTGENMNEHGKQLSTKQTCHSVTDEDGKTHHVQVFEDKAAGGPTQKSQTCHSVTDEDGKTHHVQVFEDKAAGGPTQKSQTCCWVADKDGKRRHVQINEDKAAGGPTQKSQTCHSVTDVDGNTRHVDVFEDKAAGGPTQQSKSQTCHSVTDEDGKTHHVQVTEDRAATAGGLPTQLGKSQTCESGAFPTC